MSSRVGSRALLGGVQIDMGVSWYLQNIGW
jgi:hypothetical protein